ncbi:hypothetical protein A3K34_01775 [candidate division WWE3 bacterium RIFOXYC1_FULL_40_10]|uniref:Diacylglycerol glucosyltransferase N-terminal domain-containing protein n=1 Tax=candidate division WWE3 bacterium RIFOXYA2_FULL_46_9 TaxID=1802636 RepID=A0A1F4W2J2_UNCKA|nr:MAG: hypothetical protein A3K58_01775 [candidate division WWE3 bacterium RIFOXYB1_FULL_40_22]OGC61592.1 MAG: hypothetical protein A3K37_01775 [candidate division WWE3 bacterium RIFOXYA1_FULL_40_11]OGC63639.1 MAG: hypothetical protein A2264_04720 [candidate division WWE3 bacterium RIFOXYA2_FULL_46_9]OGC64730.1 MAG: hypothetical protein A2326_01675 [candidate division WWE3 bacterium RIFOXYB2_FULL_41_6]OGC65975.1 MAG: hypothetical protein A3K34_01775 [candidate division WWE3 bacterium RIFOXYC1_
MNYKLLKDKSLVVVFTYAPAGLGHLRVSNALSEGLPGSVTPLLVGSDDKITQNIHKFMSIHSLSKQLMEFSQSGWAEDIFTPIYRRSLRANTDETYDQLVRVIKQRIDVPKEVLVIATHFGLAIQIASIKDKFESENGVKMHLIVQVTDDSPQHMWYVPGADLTFVPSERTKEALLRYGHKAKLPLIDIVVLPYPISPTMAKELTEHRREQRSKQLDPYTDSQVNVCIPVSGAAVGMDYFDKIMQYLHRRSRKFVFHIVSKNAPFTQYFLFAISMRPYARLYTSTHDREVVDLYEDLYSRETISLEITKPSEQAFKALYNCKQIGGSVLLFTLPVGRQEYDNLDFLRRHNLIFSKSTQARINSLFERDKKLSKFELDSLFGLNDSIRGIQLPNTSHKAADFIWWCLSNGIFKKMACSGCHIKDYDSEIRSNSVELFWERIEQYLIEQGENLI